MTGFVLGFAFVGLCLIACDSTEPEPTDPNAEIIITSPRGGESFQVGDSLKVTWKLQGLGFEEVDAVNIEISPDSGKTWLTLLTRSIGLTDVSWGNFSWAIPATLESLGITYNLAGNSGCKIKIMQYSTSDPNKIAVMKKPFTITPR